MVRDPLRHVASVEAVRPVLADPGQGGGEITLDDSRLGLAEEGRRRLPILEEDPLRLWITADHVLLRRQQHAPVPVDFEPLLGKADRGGNGLAQRFGAEPAQRHLHAADHARHRHRTGTVGVGLVLDPAEPNG